MSRAEQSGTEAKVKIVKVATVGDIILTIDFIRKMQSDADCLALIKLLASADVRVGNYEGSIINIDHFDSYPDALSGFGWLITDPKAVLGLKVLDFELPSRANNHATDWGRTGMAATNTALRQYQFSIAGTGDSRTTSREPVFRSGIFTINQTTLPIKAEFNVCMHSWTTEVVADSTPSDALFTVKARPGVNTLRRHTRAKAGYGLYDKIKQITSVSQMGPTTDQCIVELDEHLPADELQVTSKIDKLDHQEIIQSIKKNVNKSIYQFNFAAQHHHGAYNNTSKVEEEMQAFSRTVVDEGIDLLFGHGPHRLRGIEIYKKRPIFYSLGNFFFTDNTQQILTWDEWQRYIWRVLNRHLPDG